VATTATRNGNTLYLEASGGASTIDALSVKNVAITSIFITSGTSAEVLTLRDVTTTNIKLVLTGTADSTVHFSLTDNPINFPNGIRVTLAETDSHVTLIIKDSRA
jgi:hypothetical protein